MIRDEVREIGSMGELEGENTERVSQVGKLKVPDFDIIKFCHGSMIPL